MLTHIIDVTHLVIHFQYSTCISSLFLQGMWIGLLCGIGMQTLMVWRTNWDEQVYKKEN